MDQRASWHLRVFARPQARAQPPLLPSRNARAGRPRSEPQISLICLLTNPIVPLRQLAKLWENAPKAAKGSVSRGTKPTLSPQPHARRSPDNTTYPSADPNYGPLPLD